MKVTDLAKVVAPEAKHEIVGIRPGEKLHEQMIGYEDAPYTFEYDNHFKILPAIYDWFKDKERIKNGKLVDANFIYTSDNNSEWMSNESLQMWLDENSDSIGKI